jgi:flavin-dependent dehydrogenase
MAQPESFDVLVVGAGPAGSCAARAAALAGARVILVERRRQVGFPVQCAEFVPWQLGHQVPIPARCIAQTIGQMRTFLPDGTVVDKQAAGYVLDRALWDRYLAVLACQAGAELRTGWAAKVGVAVNVRLGGRPEPALEHLLDKLALPRTAIVGTLGGPVPVGGPVVALRSGPVLLVGDAAGLTHPLTGGGIAPAVLSGQLAGQAAARAVAGQGGPALDFYPQEWEAAMGAAQRQALANRRALDAGWSDNPATLSDRIRETWIAFPAYGRRKQNTTGRASLPGSRG